MRMLDLFCGRFGWGRAFAARGWEVVGIDLVPPAEVPNGCRFMQGDILKLEWLPDFVKTFDFVCASSPCEEFSLHGMKHFHPNPPFPDMGLVLFCYTRRLLERSGVAFVMENVRAATEFVGPAKHKCGSFYLWGNAVPPLMAQGVTKGYSMSRAANNLRGRKGHAKNQIAAVMAEIAPELAGSVADYAERLLEMRATA